MSKTKWLAVVLVVSLAINIYFVTHLIGRQDRTHEVVADMTLEYSEKLISRLPEARKEEIRLELAETVQQMVDLYQSTPHKRGELEDLLTAEALNKDAVNALFVRKREYTHQMQTLRQKLMLDLFSQLTPQERRDIVRGMVRGKKVPRASK